MSLYDVRNSDTPDIDRIKWVGNNVWDLVKAGQGRGVRFSEVNLISGRVSCSLVNTKTEAENLIKAIKKAIELGWLS